ncbi:MAG TPA: nuclear transport factor 2 family protein [Steroidobacteraceae bacterium]|nr:nuclear transport factor 2 family protein [Steroidobacteraceae bacterium]
MKYVRYAAATIVVFMLHANAPAGNVDSGADKSVREKILALEEERNQAILHGDAMALDRMTSDDYTFITLRGEMRSKAEILRDFRAGAIKYQSREISDLNVRVYGNSAVVTGRAIQKGMENGKDYSGDYWFTRVYVNQHGRWMSVALQTTLIQR